MSDNIFERLGAKDEEAKRIKFLAESPFAPRPRPGLIEPPQTHLWRRADGTCLLYPGRVHTFFGDAESRKSWAALAALRECIKDLGRPVLHIDYEDSDLDFWPRVERLGLTQREQEELIWRATPEEPFSDRDVKAVVAEVEAYSYGLVVINGVTAALATQGLMSKDDTNVARFIQGLPLRLAHTRCNPSVVIVDHPNNSDKKRPAGSHYKVGGVEAAYQFEDRGYDTTRIVLRKDRPKYVRQAHGKIKFPEVADFRLVDQDDGTIRTELLMPKPRAEAQVEKAKESAETRQQRTERDQRIRDYLLDGKSEAWIRDELHVGTSTIQRVKRQMKEAA